MFNKVYQSLKDGFNRSWLRFILKNTSMGQFLNENNHPTLFEFLNIYFSSWWKNLWIKLFIKNKESRNQFQEIIKAVNLLRQKYEQDSIGSLFEVPDRFEITFQYYKTLFHIIANHNYPLELTTNIVKNNASMTVIDAALKILIKYKIATTENIETVSKHASPDGMSRALETLKEAGLLTPENREFIFKLEFPFSMASDINKYPAIFQENRGFISRHAYPYGLPGVFEYLKKARILNQESLDLINTQYHFEERLDTESLISMLEHLSCVHINLLTQENFNSLMHPDHAFLISHEAKRYWSRIPYHLFTQTNFRLLLDASRAANPLRQLRVLTNQILGIQEEPQVNLHVAQAARNFNTNQSTHTASVHGSVSESARKLMKSYIGGLNLKAKIQEIRVYVNGLESSLKNDAAKRCIARISNPDYSFTDSSNVSTSQLLAFAYTAIHDESKRQGTLEDAKILFIEALYEIQRGYNLNEQGVDDNTSGDRPICSAGTFNKLMEKLNGIHSDVEIYYITSEAANLKFPKLAEKHALQYLRSIASPNTSADYQQCKAIIDIIQRADSIEPIWDKIKNDVAREIWDEFKLAYGDNSKDIRYLALISHGCQSLEAPKALFEIETQLLSSVGYQQSMALQAHTSCKRRRPK